MSQNTVVKKYIFFIGIVFFALLLGRIYYDVTHQKNMLQERLENLDTQVQKSFISSQKSISNIYKIIITQLTNSQNIFDLVKNKDTKTLHALLEENFKNFKTIDPYLETLHFFDTKNTTILRMHKPEQYNDNLTDLRPLIAYVNKTLVQQNGFEIGKNGIYFRIATPFIFHNEHVGAIEFGIDIRYFSNLLKDQYGVSTATIVKTAKLNALEYKKPYQEWEEYSIISRDNIFQEIFPKLNINQKEQIIHQNNRTYLVLTNLDFKDYQHSEVAKIILAQDITILLEQSNKWLKYVNFLSFFIFIFILVFMYYILKRFSKDLEKQQNTIHILNKKSEILQTKADTDELTKIYNKRFFDNYLQTFIKEKKGGCIIFFDIDHFKYINDTYGHITGDIILKKLAKFVSTSLRKEDIFGRWGGEEFIILLENLSMFEACQKAEQIRKQIESKALHENIIITLSLGITCIRASDTATNLLKRADSLLYKAKAEGRNRITF